MQPRFWENQDFWNIFILAFSIALAKVVTKYITKLRSSSPHGYTRSDHFDCLRLGVDFAFIGFVGGLGVLRALLKQARDPLSGASTFNSLIRSQSVFLATETLLLLAAILFAGLFYDWSSSFYRGIFVPGVFGLVSLMLSLMLFLSLVH